mgnify:CR=1 FL=1
MCISPCNDCEDFSTLNDNLEMTTCIDCEDEDYYYYEGICGETCPNEGTETYLYDNDCYACDY